MTLWGGFVIYLIIIESVRVCEYNIIDVLYHNSEDINMDYLTTAECAKLWNISQRRVAIYCKEGRIDGAILMGKMWLIPKGTIKPEDPRKKKTRDENDNG